MSETVEPPWQPTAAIRDPAGEPGRSDGQPPAPDRQARRKDRAGALCVEIDQRFQAVAAGSSGAIAYRHRADHYGRFTATLSWRDPAPPRALQIYINPLEGMLEWSWVVSRVRKNVKRTDALSFDRARLNELLALLADQETWCKGPLPV
jgi:hypothetical protein